MKLVCVLFIIMSLNFDFVMPVDLHCSYEFSSWYAVGRIHYCKVQNNLNIVSLESAVISGATGSHDGSKTNDDVHGFYAENKKIEIFPRGLEKIYKNLKAIVITYGRIKEIHQSDLKPFSQLELLSLYDNGIEVLEEGLFDFNPKLGYISFNSNKISQIHPNIFDRLTKLTYLELERNQCINKIVQDNSAKVKELIKEVKLQCPSPSIAYKEVQKLKLNFNDQNLQFTEKLTKVEKTCQNSFLELSPKISSLEATSKDLLTRVENTAASLSASNSKNAQELQALHSKMSEMELTTNSSNKAMESHLNSKIQDNKKLIEATEASNLKKMEQNMQTCSQKIEAQNKMFSDKINTLEESSKRSIKEMEARLVLQHSEDVKALNSTIKLSETRFHKNMQAVSRAMAFQNKASNDKIDQLEKALKTTDTNLQNLKSEIFGAFGKLLEKLEENAAKIERRTAPKMEAIMTTLKSQNLAFADLNQKMISLETGLATLQSELMEGKNTAQSSCGLGSDEDTN